VAIDPVVFELLEGDGELAVVAAAMVAKFDFDAG
jgi:hypothetical protein